MRVTRAVVGRDVDLGVQGVGHLDPVDRLLRATTHGQVDVLEPAQVRPDVLEPVLAVDEYAPRDLEDSQAPATSDQVTDALVVD